MNGLSLRTDLPAFLLFVLLIVGVLQVSGNLAGTGPRIVDDNQIYKLQIEFSQIGFLGVLKKDVLTRIYTYKRMVPLYSVQKVIAARILKTNLVAWRLYCGLIGALAAYFLYLFARAVDFSPTESVTFALLTMWGPQSVIFWKPLQGEGLGMLLLSASLLTMALGLRRSGRAGSKAYTALHIVFAIAASLTKESFILMLPAMVILRIWLVLLRDNAGTRKALGACMAGSAILTVTCLAEIILIKFGPSDTSPVPYAGWAGFQFDSTLRTLWQFGAYCAPGFLLILAFITAQRFLFRPNVGHVLRARRSYVIPALGLLLLIVIPQILLYSKSGFSGVAYVHPKRYLLPAVLGLSLLSLLAFRLTRPIFHNQANGHPDENAGIKAIAWRSGTLALLLALFVCGNGWVVVTNASAYAQESRALRQWYDSIRNHTAPTDPIVVVYHRPVNAVRLRYILEAGLDRKNLFFMSQPRGLFLERCARSPGKCNLHPGHGPHLSTMRDVSSVGDLSRVKAFLFVTLGRHDNYGGGAESMFLADASRKALLQHYKRYAFGPGRVSYYRER